MDFIVGELESIIMKWLPKSIENTLRLSPKSLTIDSFKAKLLTIDQFKQIRFNILVFCMNFIKYIL